jgi:hypothetical protein
MFIQMACSCGAEYQASTDDENHDTLLQVWAQSFINSHTDCGFMSVPHKETQENMRLMDTIHKEPFKKEL